jgi:hypothetical protein
MTGVLWWLLMSAATVYPMWTILGRLGIDARWSLVCLTGVGLVGLLWYLAFARNVGGSSGVGGHGSK